MNIMKHTGIITLVLTIMAASSCSTYYSYMTTGIRRDLSADRTVWTQADSAYLAGDRSDSPFFFKTDSLWETGPAAEPFSMDFHDETMTMNAYASRHLENIGGNRMHAADKDMERNPLLSPEESASREFRWFYTIYTYKAVYRQIADLPVPLSEYMDRKEQEILFRETASPAGWNGVEMYCILDDLNSMFAKWYVHCTFKVSYDIIYALAGQPARRQMESFKDESLKKILSDDNDISPESLCRMLDKHFNTDDFGRLYRENKDFADSGYSEKESILYDFGISLISETRLPGKLVSTNASAFNEGYPQWKIDGYRLLYGDLTLEASSRTANIWAFAVTFLVLAATLYLIRRYTVRR